MLKVALLIGTGGFAGTVARYFVQLFIQRWSQSLFPWGTFTVNILGSFLIGVFYAMSERSNLLTPEIRLMLTVGFCGGFTTFSSFSYNIFNLVKDSGMIANFIYIAGSILFGVLAVYLGIIFTKLFY